MNQQHPRPDRQRDSSAGGGPIDVFVNAYGQSETGRDRSTHEDQFLIAVLNRRLEVVQTSLGDGDGHDLDEPAEHGWVFLVADGRGDRVSGEDAGAVTARTGLSFLRSTMPWFATLGPEQLERAEEVLKTVVRRTHGAVSTDSDIGTSARGARSALTLAYVLWPHLFVVHTGDNRCYLVRDGEMRRLAAERSRDPRDPDPNRRGRDDLVEARAATRPVVDDGEPPPQPIVTRWVLRNRDTLLLCSMGLTRSLSDEQIEGILGDNVFANARCQALVEAAHAAGATDNTTVVVASFEEFAATTDAS